MSDKIKLLPEIVANQIKAGEVVAYPSSAVKEMMENAVDAGADKITVNFRNGGRDLIQIVDNGCGMSPNDARMAFECHATSKISSVEDIYALHTFGFRGEALAAIAAVSQVELLSRQSDSEIGTQTIVNGGEFVSQKPVATPVGSQFLVRNIFYNTPARRKFIDNKEFKLVADIKNEFRRVALCHPEVEMELLNDGAPIYALPKSNLAERIVRTIGASVKNNLLEVGVETTIASISGFVGKPSSARLRGGEQYMFVNGRFFKSPYLNKAILKAYEKLIPEGNIPSFFIYITVEADRVDVNVHAQKTEVKFADAEAVWQILNAAVRETLAKTGAVPLLDFDNESSIEIPVATRGVVYDEPRATTRDYYDPFASDNGPCDLSTEAKPYGMAPNSDFDSASAADDFILPSDDEEFEYIESGEEATQQNLGMDAPESDGPDVMLVDRRYAMFRSNGRLYAADLVRARERVMYDSYMAMLGSSSSASQQLLFPETLTVSNDEYAILEEYSVDFAALGFDMEFVGDCTVCVRGIPADASDEKIDELVYDMIRALSVPQDAASHRREQLAASLARNAAASKGVGTRQEAETLLKRLSASTDPGYSPSGRPILAEITADDIKNKLS